MTDADNKMNSLHVGSDLADIRIRLRINPEIHIGSGSLLFEILALAEDFALSEHSLVAVTIIVANCRSCEFILHTYTLM